MVVRRAERLLRLREAMEGMGVREVRWAVGGSGCALLCWSVPGLCALIGAAELVGAVIGSVVVVFVVVVGRVLGVARVCGGGAK